MAKMMYGASEDNLLFSATEIANSKSEKLESEYAMSQHLLKNPGGRRFRITGSAKSSFH